MIFILKILLVERVKGDIYCMGVGELRKDCQTVHPTNLLSANPYVQYLSFSVLGGNDGQSRDCGTSIILFFSFSFGLLSFFLSHCDGRRINNCFYDSQKRALMQQGIGTPVDRKTAEEVCPLCSRPRMSFLPVSINTPGLPPPKKFVKKD